MNDDLISREALKKEFDEYIKANPDISGIFEVGKSIIDSAETASPKERCIANIHFDKEQLQEIVNDELTHSIKVCIRDCLTDFLSFLYSRQTYKDENRDGDGWSMADLIYLADEYCEGLNDETQN